ncbi:MAG: tetraacyldisaccharide 4'-kinase [Sedimentisphaerales bacterium]|nr:tetraacyldisaccharide 4'-kinase [Sedimentisphaerales bacterium]
MNQQTYCKLISGQSSSISASILRFLLGIAAIGYSFVVRLRDFLYSKRLLKMHNVDASILCVGNITTGGTGKTPLVAWLCNLISQNYKCAILTRGYKAKSQESKDFKDEIAILAESCPGAEVIVNPDRVAGAAEAIDKYTADVLIMDDGFQHRRLARDLDIIAIDATQPFGYGKVLPAGLLREPVSSLKRAGAIVITRCDQVTDAELDKLETKLRAIKSDMVIAKSVHAPVYAKSKDDKEISIEQLKGKKVFAFCGIGNPDAFLNTIKSLGAKPAGSAVFDDHHHYTSTCLTEITERAKELGADLILTTQKDWTKVSSKLESGNSASQPHPPFACLAIEIKFIAGHDKLTTLIKQTLAGKIHQKQ